MWLVLDKESIHYLYDICFEKEGKEMLDCLRIVSKLILRIVEKNIEEKKK